MFTHPRHTAIKFILIYTLLFYAWVILFQNNLSLRLWGANMFPLIGGSVSSLWLFQAYRHSQPHHKRFWLLLCIGVFLYFTANLLWFIIQILLDRNPFPGPADFFWIASYFIFLTAVLHKWITLRRVISSRAYAYNILIFMTVATTLSTYYLIWPLIVQTEDYTAATVISIAYPVLDIIMLFAALNMYYLAQYSDQRKVLLLLSAGFTLQIIADTVHMSLNLTGTYESGHFIDPLWQVCLLLCGLAGLYEVEEGKARTNEGINNLNPFYIGFPYLSVIVLFLLVIKSSHITFNILSAGFGLVLLLTLLRQIYITVENTNLIKEYRQLAYKDSVTGLYNRTKFHKDLCDFLARSGDNQTTFGMMLIDLDRFKNINDTMGHPVGDQLLAAFAHILRKIVPQDDYIYRIGGDEFVIIVQDLTASDCVELAEALIQNMAAPFKIQESEIIISPSIGISLYPDNGSQPDDLLKNADTAMYHAKETGKNNVKLYSPELNEKASRRMNLEHGLRKALENNEFTVLYQPKVNLKTNEIVGVEALLRWNHPQYGIISPMQFIPLAEETGQIVPIGEWVLRKACLQNKLWQDKGLPKVHVSVNVSVRQFQRSFFVGTVREVLQTTGLSPQDLDLEVTENVLHDTTTSVSIITELRAMGVGISLDDFGTGYSSLHVLRALPVNTIKIDKSFIVDITASKASQSIVRAIIEMCNHLKLSVVAEGIEDAGQLQQLRQYDCTVGQGYYFKKPMSADAIEKLLRNGILTEGINN
jgi:diguanylate cyclase (GGDEF)-like protein